MKINLNQLFKNTAINIYKRNIWDDTLFYGVIADGILLLLLGVCLIKDQWLGEHFNLIEIIFVICFLIMWILLNVVKKRTDKRNLFLQNGSVIWARINKSESYCGMDEIVLVADWTNPRNEKKYTFHTGYKRTGIGMIQYINKAFMQETEVPVVWDENSENHEVLLKELIESYMSDINKAVTFSKPIRTIVRSDNTIETGENIRAVSYEKYAIINACLGIVLGVVIKKYWFSIICVVSLLLFGILHFLRKRDFKG